MTALLIDNFDSFTYNVYHYLQLCGLQCSLMRSNEPVLEEIERKDYDGIVFSPGPMRPQNHPVMMQVLQRYYASKPILGICLGHQAIGEFFGASLVKSPVPVHGKISRISHTGHPMFKNIPEDIFVARYHSLSVTDLEKTVLHVTSATADGIAMSLAHNELPIWGVQFHPEAIQTQYGLQILKNWTSIFS